MTNRSSVDLKPSVLKKGSQIKLWIWRLMTRLINALDTIRYDVFLPSALFHFKTLKFASMNEIVKEYFHQTLTTNQECQDSPNHRYIYFFAPTVMKSS